MIEIELPDGSVAEFPDGTPPEAIKGALQKRFGAPAAPAALSRAGGGHRVPEYTPPGVEGYDPKTGMVQRYSRTGSASMGAADMGAMGFGDEAAAGLGYLIDKLPGGRGDSYSDILREVRGNQDAAYNDNPAAYIGGMAGAGLAGGAAMAKGGLSLAARAAQGVGSLGRIAAGSAADGAIMGTVQGAGSGTSLNDRIGKAAIGGGTGLGIGLAAPYAVSTAQGLASPVVSALMSRLRPDSYANAAIGEGIRKSGSSADKIVKALEAAQADDQAVYSIADAMGHSGQRMLSTVARNPNDARQAVIEALNARQAGQGRRVTGALAEAFDTPDTAAARTARLTQARAAEGNELYTQARKDAGPVNVSPVLAAIDETLLPGVNAVANPSSQIANDSIEGALSRARSMLSDGRSNLTDFNSVFRAKLDLDDMITKAEGQGATNRAHYLNQVQRVLDDALAEASPSYTQARDKFAAASRTIEAVDTGKIAATRGRSADTIAAFKDMTPQEQVAFRAGYVDPLIAQTEGAAVGVDKSRALISDATGREFPVFAAPDKGRQLWDRLGREKTMFETRNAAIGGSRTADNIADAADIAQFDPSVMSKLFRGDIVGAGLSAATRAFNETKGLPPSVLAKVGQALMVTDPAVAAQVLTAGAKSATTKTGRRALASTIINALSAPAAGRL